MKNKHCKMSKEFAKDGKNPKKGKQISQIQEISRKLRSKRSDSKGVNQCTRATVANVNKTEKKVKGKDFPVNFNENKSERKGQQKEQIVSENSDRNNNASLLLKSNEGANLDLIRSGTKRKIVSKQKKGNNSDETIKKTKEGFSPVVDEIHAGTSQCDSQQATPKRGDQIIGIQIGGKLNQIQVGHSIDDGIILDVDTHEFDLVDDVEGMAASDESSNDEEMDHEDSAHLKGCKKPTQSCASERKTSNENKTITFEEFARSKGDEAMKRIFNEWLTERIGMDQLPDNSATTSKTAVAVSNAGKTGRCKKESPTRQNKLHVTADGRQGRQNSTLPVEIKSPSDTTIYTPAFRKVQAKTNSNDAIIQQVSNFVDAMRFESEKAEQTGANVMHPGLDEVKKRTQQTVIEAEKFRAAINTPPGMCTQNFNAINPQMQFGNRDHPSLSQLPIEAQHEESVFPHDQVGENNLQNLNKGGSLDQNLVQMPHMPLIGQPGQVVEKFSDDDFFHLTCHIEPSLRAKIERGEYVDLEKLLPNKTRSKYSEDTRLEWLHRDGGTFLVPATSDRENKINGIRHWDQAFRVYATIYCGANPHRSRKIWQYVSVINTAATAYIWDNVANYDYTFRHLMEFNPQHSWASTYNQMWNLSMRDPLPKNTQFEQNSFGHFNKNSSGGQSLQLTSHSVQSASGGSGKKKSRKQVYCTFFKR